MSPPRAVRFNGTNVCWNEHEHFFVGVSVPCSPLFVSIAQNTLACLEHHETKQTIRKKKNLLERGNKANLIREAFRCCRSFEVVATKEQFDTPLGTSSAQGNPTRRTNLETPSKNRSTTGKRKVSIGKTKNSITCPRQMLSELAFRSEQDLLTSKTLKTSSVCLTGPDRNLFFSSNNSLKVESARCPVREKIQRLASASVRVKKRKDVQSGSLAGLIIQGFTRSDQRSEDRIARVIWGEPKGDWAKGGPLEGCVWRFNAKRKTHFKGPCPWWWVMGRCLCRCGFAGWCNC